MGPLLAAEAGGGSAVGLSEALVGLPVAVVIVALCLYAWRLLSQGRVILGREHDELRDDRDFWRSTALRALNLGEAVAGRRRDPGFYDGGGG